MIGYCQSLSEFIRMRHCDTKDALSERAERDPTVPVPPAIWLRLPAALVYYSNQTGTIFLSLTYPPMFLHRKHTPLCFYKYGPHPLHVYNPQNCPYLKDCTVCCYLKSLNWQFVPRMIGATTSASWTM